MGKKYWKAANLLNPLPVVLVSCGGDGFKDNVMTAAWAGTICSDPVMVSVSIRKSRYSHAIIKQTKEFVIGMPNKDLVLYTDYVGIYSGKKVDKFNLTGNLKVTKIPSKFVNAPTIAECPISLECKVQQIIELGSHDMFIAEVVGSTIDDKYLNENESLDLHKAELLSYCHGEYYTLGKCLGKFGFSSKKPEKAKRHQKTKEKNK